MSASGRTRARSIDRKRREPTPYEEAMVAYEKKMKEWEAKMHFDMLGTMPKERYDKIMSDKFDRHTELYDQYSTLSQASKPVPTAITNRMDNLARDIDYQQNKFREWYKDNPQPVKPEEPEEQEKECDEEGVCVISGGKTRKAKKSKKSKAKKAKKSKKSKKSKAKKSKAKKSKKYRH